MRRRSVEHEGFGKVRGLSLVDVTVEEDRKALEEVNHFARYALAMYTWYLYVFERPCCGACDLLCFSCTGRSRAFHKTRGRRKWASSHADDDNINGDGRLSLRGDNWLGTHEAGLLRVAGLHPGCELVDAQFTSGIEATPYCLLVDHDWRCVVVSIRGTMSLDDCLCDLQAHPKSMEESGRRWGFDGSDMLAH
ncbi:unnamed protein product, partial [Laminaria digitata]